MCNIFSEQDPARIPVDITMPAPIPESDDIVMTPKELEEAGEAARAWVAQVGVTSGIV
ncbi:MAG: hypothetical protein UX82_C0011G0002 [Microgenomates group bacterium GW2011_GWE1_47_12]|nr:MAG: hypothetical protein UX32_C0023G0004 [Microgenomates group bacterium GW2011_GWF1_46_12]KKU27545.1 MAG: hypothetical protein UX40_C0011G0006 [Microgenomates group bacterium GW2011_GWF2_46_18]KKU60440.1 MAG: hypothetical protein UX82_C0011G0002 [Microgenomates group bacterium GW2011_GWE1_47_12]KKU62448.1 MAG: hypothetical protein UX84_C0007G0034 [Microgenomates group bacterium GW2011_GWD1_47_13]